MEPPLTCSTLCARLWIAYDGGTLMVQALRFPSRVQSDTLPVRRFELLHCSLHLSVHRDNLEMRGHTRSRKASRIPRQSRPCSDPSLDRHSSHSGTLAENPRSA